MWRATPELVRTLRRRYENTDQSMKAIAEELGTSERTLTRMAKTEGWRRRSDRLQGLPKAVQLLEQAEALAALASPPPERGRSDCQSASKTRVEALMAVRVGVEPIETPTPTLPLAGGGSQSAIDRLEALVVQEIAAAEQARAQTTDKRQLAKISDKSARTLATLTQTLRNLQQMRTGKPLEPEMNDNDDDMPRDLDEFRLDLARRIDAFVASRTDAAGADGNSPAPLAGDE